MLDGVLRWLVQVTGLEPKLLTLTAILIVYAASVYRFVKEKTSVPPARPIELGEFASALTRIERGIETVAKYLVNLNLENQPQNQAHEPISACPFFPPRVAGSPPRNHHRPENGSRTAVPQKEIEEEEAYFPVPGMTKTHPSFYLPLPVIPPRESAQHKPVQPEEPPVQHSPDENLTPEPELQPSMVVTETLKRMSRKAGRRTP